MIPIHPPLAVDAISAVRNDYPEIANSLDEFLLAWEALCYVGPESWMPRPFSDPATGLLEPSSQKAELLRKLFARVS